MMENIRQKNQYTSGSTISTITVKRTANQVSAKKQQIIKHMKAQGGGKQSVPTARGAAISVQEARSQRREGRPRNFTNLNCIYLQSWRLMKLNTCLKRIHLQKLQRSLQIRKRKMSRDRCQNQDNRIGRKDECYMPSSNQQYDERMQPQEELSQKVREKRKLTYEHNFYHFGFAYFFLGAPQPQPKVTPFLQGLFKGN